MGNHAENLHGSGAETPESFEGGRSPASFKTLGSGQNCRRCEVIAGAVLVAAVGSGFGSVATARRVGMFNSDAVQVGLCEGVYEEDVTQNVTGAGVKKRVEVPTGLMVVEGAGAAAPVGALRAQP